MSVLANLVVRMSADTAALERGFKGAHGSMSKLTGLLKTGAVAGGAALVGLGVASLKMGMDFEKTMAEVKTLMPDISEKAFGKMTDDVLAFSKEMGIATDKAVPALYQAISAGIPRQNVMEFMKVASKTAIGGVTDLETAVDGLTTVVNAFGLEASETGRVADVLFTGVKLGKTTIAELSTSMFQAAPLAASLGLKIEDVVAATTTLTKSGTPTAQAMTQIRQAMVALAKPNADMISLLEKTAYTSGEALLQSEGFAGALDILTEAAGGNKEMIAKAFGSVEALQAVLGLTGDAALGAAKDLAAVTDSAGAAEEAFRTISETTAFKLNKAINDIKVEMTKIAVEVLPRLVEAFDNLKTTFTEIKDSKIVQFFKDFAEISIKGLVDGISELATFLKTHKELVYAIIAAYAAWEIVKIAHALIELASAVSIANMSLAGRGGLIASFALLGYVMGIYLGQKWPSVWEGVVKVTEASVNGIIDAINGIIDALNWIVDQARKLPFADAFLGHVPKLQHVGWTMGGAVGNSMVARLNELKEVAASSGAGAGAEYAIAFAETAAAGLRGMAIALREAVVSTGLLDLIPPSVGPALPMAAALRPLKALLDVSTNLIDVSNKLTASAKGAAWALREEAAAASDAAANTDAAAAAAGGAGGAAGELSQAVDILTPGMAALNTEVEREEVFLVNVAKALMTATTQHDMITEAITTTEKALDDAERAMSDWENAVLKGTRAFSDLAFGISRDMDKAQLAINKINLGVLEEGLEEGGYASDALERKVRRLAQTLGVELFGGALDWKDIQKVLDAAADSMRILALESENVRLSESITLGGQQRVIDQRIEDLAGYAEFTLPEILQGLKDSKDEVDKHISALGDWNGALIINEIHMAFLQGLLDNHRAYLTDIRDLYIQIEQAAQDAWAAAAQLPAGTSVTPALPTAVPLYHQGGYVPNTGLAMLRAGETVIAPGGGSGAPILVNIGDHGIYLMDRRQREAIVRQILPELERRHR